MVPAGGHSPRRHFSRKEKQGSLRGWFVLPLLNKSSRSSGFSQCIITEETEACNDLGPHTGLEVKHRFNLQTGRKELCFEDVALP